MLKLVLLSLWSLCVVVQAVAGMTTERRLALR
jgi:hypothetical protein